MVSTGQLGRGHCRDDFVGPGLLRLGGALGGSRQLVPKEGEQR